MKKSYNSNQDKDFYLVIPFGNLKVRRAGKEIPMSTGREDRSGDEILCSGHKAKYTDDKKIETGPVRPDFKYWRGPDGKKLTSTPKSLIKYIKPKN